MSLLVLGLNHRTAPVALREKLTVDEGQLPPTLETLAGRVAPGVILSTCNRLEIYTLTDDGPGTPEPLEQLRQFLSEFSGVPPSELAPFFSG